MKRKGLQRKRLCSTAQQTTGQLPAAGGRAARHHSPAHESILAIYHQFRHLWRRSHSTAQPSGREGVAMIARSRRSSGEGSIRHM
ncbi:hypothetical protein WJX81_001750 [Elliptochloris bilobata]|uniref:Uncharacterized protein n=1 Tax=Elliptochloris bilobata TaxID=381761 RepID=A0AAW1S4L2_9CHLO